MPISITAFNKDITDHIKAINPSTVLDIGAGMGKYQEIVSSINNNIICDAIESTNSYVEQYELRKKYRNVFVQDIVDFVKTDRVHKYDLCIMGDVLEHLFLSEAIDVIDALCYKSKHLMIIWPTNLPQDSEWENHFEMHKSNFFLKDITRFNIQVYKKTFGFYRNRLPVEFNYALIAGHTTANDEIIRKLNFNNEGYVIGIINDV